MKRSVEPGPTTGSVRIEGVRPVLEALRAGRRRVWRAQLPAEARSAALRELRAELEARAIPVSEGEHALAWADPFPQESLEQLLVGAPVDVVVALDGVTDVGNLGSIARSAETAGCGALLLEHRHAPPLNEGAFRASAGALEHLRVARTPNLRRALELLRAEGFTVLAAAPGGVELAALEPARLRGKLVWVLGSEDRGARAGVLAQADALVGIPLRGRIESLGVAAAAAYVLHRGAELRRAAATDAPAPGAAARSEPAESAPRGAESGTPLRRV